MPVHDWSEVDANVFHHFHQYWSVEICKALTDDLPDGYSALVEQHSPKLIPDVLAVERRPKSKRPRSGGGVATLPAPRTRYAKESKEQTLAGRGNRIAIHHRMGDIVCIIEIVSPGNKQSRPALRAFVDKTVDFLEAGVHVVVVDLFPPNALNPLGLQELIGADFKLEPLVLPPEEPLLLASYRAESPYDDTAFGAFLEPLGFGARFPDMPAFLESDFYVNLPLEETYMRAWDSCPKDMRYLVEHGKLPDE